MEKTPKIPATPMALDIWYESGDFVVADKPAGMAVYPETTGDHHTVVNGLLQSNRWLAEMEHSEAPGVIHKLQSEDRGLVLVAKSDDTVKALRKIYSDHGMTFSYRVRTPRDTVPRNIPQVTIRDHHVYDEGAVWDIDSPLGDTAQLRRDWLGEGGESTYFVAYAIDAPGPPKHVRVAMGDRRWLPSLELYTIPPCSICNGTKALIAAYGFGYRDHTLDTEAVIAEMRRVRGSERGIPVIVLDGVVSVGFDRRRLKQALGLY